MTARTSPPMPWSGISTRSSRRTARSSTAPVGQGLAYSGGRRLSGGRQVYARDHHQGAGRDAALPDRLDHDVFAGAMGEGRQELGRVCAARRPAPARGSSTSSRRASAPSWSRTRTIGTRRACRSSTAGAAPAARGELPRRGAALRPGRLDRGAAAGRDAVAESRGLPDRHQRLSAQLDLAFLACRRLALERRPRAQGREPRGRPRRA